MANELKVTLGVAYANGSMKDTIASEVLNITQDTLFYHGTVVSVGTSEEDLAIGDIATLGWLYLKNLDATNYVTYGPKDTTMKAFGRIEAGEFAILRLEPGITLRWQANTAAVKVLVKLYND